MKKVFRSVGSLLFPIGRIKRGLGLGELKESYKSLSSSAKEMFTRDKHKGAVKETFEQAVTRLNLTPDMLEKRKKNLLLTACFYSAIAVVIFIYTISLLFSGVFLGTFIGLVLTFVATGLAYRDHFWYIQMRQQRLGISFQDWVNYTFRGENDVKK